MERKENPTILQVQSHDGKIANMGSWPTATHEVGASDIQTAEARAALTPTRDP